MIYGMKRFTGQAHSPTEDELVCSAKKKVLTVLIGLIIFAITIGLQKVTKYLTDTALNRDHHILSRLRARALKYTCARERLLIRHQVCINIFLPPHSKVNTKRYTIL